MIETVRRGGRPVAGFGVGEFAGIYSLKDLDTLIHNKDVEVAAMADAVGKSADSSIKQDFAALNTAYQAARADGLKAIAAIKSSFVPDALNVSGNVNQAFKDIVLALQPTPGQTTPRSMQGIAQRLQSSGWKPDYQLPYQIQSDADLTIYKTADAASKATAETAAAAAKAAHDAAIGIVDTAGEIAEHAAEHAGAAAKSLIPWQLWVGVGAVVIIGGIAIVKLAPAVAGAYLPAPRRPAT